MHYFIISNYTCNDLISAMDFMAGAFIFEGWSFVTRAFLRFMAQYGIFMVEVWQQDGEGYQCKHKLCDVSSQCRKGHLDGWWVVGSVRILDNVIRVRIKSNVVAMVVLFVPLLKTTYVCNQ